MIFLFTLAIGNWGGRPFLAFLALFSSPRVFSVVQKHVTAEQFLASWLMIIFCTKRDFRSIIISQTHCISLDPISKPRLCFEMFLLKVEDSLNVADILCLAWDSYYLRQPTNAALPSSYKCMTAVSGILKRSLIFTYFSDISASPSPSVTWLDNYSHIYHKTVTKVSQADYRSQMWSPVFYLWTPITISISLLSTWMAK